MAEVSEFNVVERDKLFGEFIKEIAESMVVELYKANLWLAKARCGYKANQGDHSKPTLIEYEKPEQWQEVITSVAAKRLGECFTKEFLDEKTQYLNERIGVGLAKRKRKREVYNFDTMHSGGYVAIFDSPLMNALEVFKNDVESMSFSAKPTLELSERKSPDFADEDGKHLLAISNTMRKGLTSLIPALYSNVGQSANNNVTAQPESVAELPRIITVKGAEQPKLTTFVNTVNDKQQERKALYAGFIDEMVSFAVEKIIDKNRGLAMRADVKIARPIEKQNIEALTALVKTQIEAQITPGFITEQLPTWCDPNNLIQRQPSGSIAIKKVVHADKVNIVSLEQKLTAAFTGIEKDLQAAQFKDWMSNALYKADYSAESLVR